MLINVRKTGNNFQQLYMLTIYCEFLSPGVHTLVIMHEVRSHIKGKADRIACSNSIYHSHLIVLMGKRKTSSLIGFKITSIMNRDSEVHTPLLCSSLPSQKQLPVLAYTCSDRPDFAKRVQQWWNMKSKRVSLVYLVLFMLLNRSVFSYNCCIWIVCLCHQSLVVHNVLKCLAGKTTRRQIKILSEKLVTGKLSKEKRNIQDVYAHPLHPWLLKSWAQSTSCCSD